MERIEHLLHQLKRIPSTWLVRSCVIILILLLAQQTAKLTWLLMPSGQTGMVSWQLPDPQMNAGQGRGELSLNQIRRQNLFGDFRRVVIKDEPKPVQINAPKTRLRLVLSGVVASSDPNKALAIIENRKVQDTYKIGEQIEGTQATLENVLPDRVLIEHRGKTETLMLDGEEFTQTTQQPTPQRRPPEEPSDNQSSGGLTKVKDSLANNPGSLTDFIQIAPVRSGDELKGFRINPGSSPELFAELGLIANDLAVSMNGYDLTDMAQAMEIGAQLKSLNQVSLTVEREGQLIEVFIALPE